MKTIETSIRWMIKRDMPEVLRIESECFARPWTQEHFRHNSTFRNVISLVLEFDGQIAGHMVYKFHSNRFHVLNLAIDPRHHRMGLGSMLMQYLFKKLSPQCRSRIVTEVVETNLSMHLFLRSLGFRCFAIATDHWEDSDLSAYLFSYRLPVLIERESGKVTAS